MEVMEKLERVIKELGVKITFIEDYLGMTRNTLNNYRFGRVNIDRNPKLKTNLEKLLSHYILDDK